MFIYPSAQEIEVIQRELSPVLQAGRPIFEIMPIRTYGAPLIKWEQGDNYKGLQQVRGLGGKPARVSMEGSKTYVMEPGYYGEFIPLDETIMTLRRPLGHLTGKVDVSDLVGEAVEKLQVRKFDRLEVLGWAALQGTISVLGPNGTILHSDTFPVQTGSVSIEWDQYATATPMADFMAWKLLARGKGCSFGRGAKAYMNAVTANYMRRNTNPNDLGGKRVGTGSTLSSIGDVNRIFDEGDLPMIVEYEGGYTNEAGTWVNHIPNGKVIIVGQRSGLQTPCDYVMTPNLSADPTGNQYEYSRVISKDQEIPVGIDVHNGHNGGPRIQYPGSVINATVKA